MNILKPDKATSIGMTGKRRKHGHNWIKLFFAFIIIIIILSIFSAVFSRIIKLDGSNSSINSDQQITLESSETSDISDSRVGESNSNNTTTISMAFFYDPGCPCSKEAKDELEKINASFDNLQQIWYNILIFSNRYEMINFSDAYNVPGNLRTDTPFLFVGDYYFHHYGVSFDNLSKVIDEYSGEDVPLWPQWKPKLTIHIAFFFDETVNETASIIPTFELINETWNEDFKILIIHYYPLEVPRNDLLLAAYFQEFDLINKTTYNDRSELFAGVFIGDYFFLNSDITFGAINDTIVKYLGQNVPLKDIRIDISGGDICIIFFSSLTCGDCHSARKILEDLKGKYPELNIKEYNIGNYDNEILRQSYLEHYNVDPDEDVKFVIFIKDEYFIGLSSLKKDLENEIKKNIDGCECPDVKADKEVVIKKFTSFTVAAVLFAGLVDSVNPCAIATLIFFIGYLSRTGRTKKQVLTIGLVYTFGIFITYMALGFGLYSIIAASGKGISTLSRALYPTIAIITILFGFYSLYDFNKARKGKKEEMALQLPKSVKNLIGRVIKHQVKLRYFALIAIITGVLISLLEFLCTGQVYLPTIMVVVATVPEYQFQAGALLFLYNLMFIMPLIIIFLSVYNGMSSEQLQGFLEKNRALFKLLTAIVFFVLAGFLIWYSWEFLF